MTLNILLVNPNTMKNPPVIPIGLEYLSNALKKYGYEVKLLDLCFAQDPMKLLDKELTEESYDIVGFTIRNTDSCIYFNNKFFLPSIKKMIQHVKKFKIDIVLGGPSFSALPTIILEYLNADFGIIGPGEIIFPEFLKLWKKKQLNQKIYNGWQYGTDSELIHLRGNQIDYPQYLSNNGNIGFQTQIGCLGKCPYCIEANKKIIFRKIPLIIEELRHLVNQGYDHFHLCDSEFNNNLDFSIGFCKALVDSKISLKWALYMKPVPYNEEIFKLLKKTNTYLISLTVDSDVRIQALNGYTFDDLVKIINYCKKYKINLAIDLLTGYPNEPIESTRETINFFKKHRPKTVGISFYYRLFDNTPMSKLIRTNPYLQQNLTRKYSNTDNFLEPIFFAKYDYQLIQELIKNDSLFDIAGLSPGVNYLKINILSDK